MTEWIDERFGPGPLFGWLCVVFLVPVVFVWVRARASHQYAPLRFSSLDLLKGVGATFVTRTRFVLPLLRTLAVLALIVAMARPQSGGAYFDASEGIAIQMVLDVSGSMAEEDFILDGRRVRRLDAVKRVFEDFVLGSFCRTSSRRRSTICREGSGRVPRQRNAYAANGLRHPPEANLSPETYGGVMSVSRIENAPGIVSVVVTAFLPLPVFTHHIPVPPDTVHVLPSALRETDALKSVGDPLPPVRLSHPAPNRRMPASICASNTVSAEPPAATSRRPSA